MELEKQVCSLELAKQLKELGVKQESLFWWIGDFLVFKTQTGFFDMRGAGMSLHPYVDHAIAAFTVAEFGEMLPHFFTLTFQRNDKGSAFVEIRDEATGINIHSFEETNEASARAKMLIHLLKEKIITL